MTIETFQQCMFRLAAMFTRSNQGNDAEYRMEVYWETLRDKMSDEQMKRATVWALRSSKFFPAAAELLEHANEERIGERYVPTAEETRAMLYDPEAQRLLGDGLTDAQRHEIRMSAFRALVEAELGPRPKSTDGAVTSEVGT
jgi:hypothetical protein